MIYLFKNPLGNVSIVFNGDDLTKEEKAQAWAVESIPEPEKRPGKNAVLNFDRKKEEIWYEYEDIPPSENEEIEQLKTDLNEAVMELSMLIAMGGNS